HVLTQRRDAIRARCCRCDPAQRPAKAYDVEFASLVFTERGDIVRRVEQYALRSAVPRKDLAGAVIAVDIQAAGDCPLRATIDIAAGDRTTAPGVNVVEDWEDVVLRAAT